MKSALKILLAFLVCASAPARAEYPDRPIRLVVPFTPGTGIDILARTWGQKFQERRNAPVVIENRPGASGNIGTEAVAKAPADGYTLLFTATTLVQSAAIYRSVPYDPKTLAPIGLAAIGNLALVAHPAVPARSVEQLISLVKAQPARLNYASPGNGTPHHLAMELLKLQSGIKIVHVPYKGTAGAVADLISGQVQLMFLPVHVALPLVKSGKLVMLAAGGAQRSPVTPEVPSLAESGVKDIDVDIWYALLGPPGLPADLVAQLNADLAAILGEADVKASLLRQGLTPRTGTPAELARLIDSDLERWRRVTREANIRAD